MAMPASGEIGILTCPSGIACSSISQAFCGNVTPPKSLLDISVGAGKTAPHCMSEFYGYAPKVVGFSEISAVGTLGSSNNVQRVLCVSASPAISAGECYSVELYVDTSTISQGSGSCTRTTVWCNSIQVYDCITPVSTACNLNIPSITVCNGTTLCISLCAVSTNTSCVNNSSSIGSINSVSQIVGGFCGSLTTCCVYTG